MENPDDPTDETVAKTALEPTVRAELVRPGDVPRADRNPAAVYLASLLPGESRRSSQAALLRAVRTFRPRDACTDADVFSFPWHQLRYEHMEALRSQLGASATPKTANKVLCVVRQVLARCKRLGLMSAEEASAARDVASVRGQRLPSGRALTPEEVTELIDACEHRSIGARDLALLSILYATGLRRSEVAGMKVEHYDRAAGTVRVIGKGNKERSVPINTKLRAKIDAWLSVRGTQSGPMICPVHRTGRIEIRHVSVSTITAILRKIMARVNEQRSTGERKTKISPHDFRRTFITTLLDNGADLSVVAKIAGHQSVDTTRIYDRRSEAAMAKAVELLPDV